MKKSRRAIFFRNKIGDGTRPKPRLVFFGTEDFSVPSLNKLISSALDYDIATVVTKPDAKAGRGQKVKEPAVKTIALKSGITVLQPKRLVDIKSQLAGLAASCGVLVAYGKILPQTIIDIFPGGIINLHPSLLPKYRGPSPIETAILNGDNQTGVSLIKLTAQMDAGPIYAQQTVDVLPNIDRLALTDHLADLGANLLINRLPSILSGQLVPWAQEHSQASYTHLLKKSDGVVNWHDETAEQIERKIRAYLGFPKTTAKIWNKHEVIITKARIATSKDDGALVMATRSGWLEILNLIAPSGRVISGAEFMRGYKQRAMNNERGAMSDQ